MTLSIAFRHTLVLCTAAAALACTDSANKAPRPAAQAASAAPASAAAADPNAVVTASGLSMVTLKAGTGVSPTATDTVKVHYRGTFMDGKEFDSSYQRGEPATFPLGGVIKCWTEGVQLMKVGGTARLTCPAELAYGERGAGGGKIPPNTPLRFDIELLAINP